MAKISWRQLQKEYDASMVGGQMVAVVEGKHVLLGHLSNGEFIFSEAGEALAEPSAPADTKSVAK